MRFRQTVCEFLSVSASVVLARSSDNIDETVSHFDATVTSAYTAIEATLCQCAEACENAEGVR
jgi:hypothetical protein